MDGVKLLPNAEANKEIIQTNVAKVYLGNEEKEQMKQFDDMKTNINKMIDNIDNINKKKKESATNIIKEINTVCDQMQTFVESLRKNLLQQVLHMKIN